LLPNIDRDGARLVTGSVEGTGGHGVVPWPVARFLNEPAETLRKTRDWLRGKWALRNCTSVGHWTRVNGKLHVVNQGQLVIGTRVQILCRFVPSVLVVFRGGRLEIGDGTMLNFGADISATKLVRIGRDCLIGTHVIILDNDFHDLLDRHRVPEPRPVTIGDRVWIGNRVIVLPGVSIGEDAAVGAGAVVTSDVPPRSVVVGNPARVVRRI
jgi:acetyltransferase-like isoleucine patch superfamily enzyme